MNILHITMSTGPESGGIGAVVLGFAHEQGRLGHHPTIWTVDSPKSTGMTVKTNDFSAEQQGFPFLGPSRLGFSPAMEWAIISCGKEHFDVLHQHSLWTAVSRVTNRWRLACNRPTVVAPHGTLEPWAYNHSKWKKQIALALYERYNLRQATCLHATSTSEAMGFRRFGLSNPIAVIPNGVPANLLRQQGDARKFRIEHSIPVDSRLLLFVSRLNPKKGLPMLFDAIAQLAEKAVDTVLVVAGFSDPPGYQRRLQQLVERLGITERVLFIGPLYGQEKLDAFCAADTFVLPTYSENFGIVVAEALATGVPVLTTHGAPWEELQTHHCGWWVNTSADAIREALLCAISCDRAELREMGQRGKLLVEHKYTWPLVTHQTIELYEWLTGRGKRPAFVIMDQ